MLNYRNQIEMALCAAKYHEDAVFDLVRRNTTATIYHIRAYLWECHSVWDYVLLQANAQTLRLKTTFVRTGTFLGTLQQKDSGYRHLPRLLSIERDASVQRIIKLRNEAHRFVIYPQEVMVREKDGVALALTIVLENHIPRQQVFLERLELATMRSAVSILEAEGFFN